MRNLIFDLETTGKVQRKLSPSSPKQPHAVQLAAEVYDDETDQSLVGINLIVRPPVPIPDEVAKLHGINNEIADRFGVRPVVAVSMFNNLLSIADRIVAHNITFDRFVMECEYRRSEKPMAGFVKFPGLCTMLLSTRICNLPPNHGFTEPKWPTLEEAYKTLVDPAGFEGAHDASNDIMACRKVYIALRDKGLC